MTIVELYQPGVIDVQIPYPTEWDELQTTELEWISQMMLHNFALAEARKAAIMVGLLELRAGIHNIALKKGVLNNLNIADAPEALELTDFIYKSNTLTHQPYLQLEAGGKKLQGPETAFNNLTVGEYEDTEVYYRLFEQEAKPEYLQQIAAILWRPAGVPYISLHDGKRVEYDLKAAQPLFAKTGPEKLYTIYTWYTGCRGLLPKLFPTVFEGGSGNGGEPDMLAFTRCIHAAAGPKNGTRDNIRLMKLKEFMLDAEFEAQAAKEFKRKNKL